jgi:general secretion pathway protein F
MQFTVKAFRQQKLATLVFEAADVQDARQRAEAQGLSVVSINSARGQPIRLGSRNRFPLVQFNQNLLTLLQAGLSLVEAIDALTERETKADTKNVLERLLKLLYEGRTFSAALGDQPSAFPPLYIATIRANETTGALPEAMERFNHYRSQIDLVKKRVIAACVYPSLILGVGGLVILFLMLYVVPRFSQVFEDLGDRIPFMSRLLLDWGRFVEAHGWAVLLGALCSVAIMAYVLTLPATRASLGRALTRIPRIGEYVRVYQLARFYRTLGMLLRGGIPVVSALEMVTGLLPLSMKDTLEAARQAIREGQPLSLAFDAHHLATAVSLRMLRVGERTGQMGPMMERIAAFHDEDVAQAIDWFIRLFEPILMVVMGAIIGVIVVLMYAPIFELAGSIQ